MLIKLPRTCISELSGPTKSFKAKARPQSIQEQVFCIRRKRQRILPPEPFPPEDTPVGPDPVPDGPPPEPEPVPDVPANWGDRILHAKSKCLNPHLAAVGGRCCDISPLSWKIADWTYSQHFDQARRTRWRKAITANHISTYDAYMMEALPHLIRGVPAPFEPPKPAGWHLKRLRPPYQALWCDPRLHWSAFPHSPALTFGLHYAKATIWPSVQVSTTFPMYRQFANVYAESFLWGVADPWAGFYRVQYYRLDGAKSPPIVSPWCPTWTEFNLGYVFNFAINTIVRARIEYCPPRMNFPGVIIQPPTPWTEKTVKVFYLEHGETFRMWPQWTPSKPGDHKGPLKYGGWDYTAPPPP